MSKNNAQQSRCPFCHGNNISNYAVPIEDVHIDENVEEGISSGAFEVKDGLLYNKSRFFCHNCGWNFLYHNN